MGVYVGRLGLEFFVEILVNEGFLVASKKVGDEVEVCGGVGVYVGFRYSFDKFFGVGFEYGF